MINFDEVIDRSGTNSSKWSVSDGELPMWVADMDFKAPKPILDVLQKRLDNGVFGYTRTPKEWAVANKNWWLRRHGVEFKEEWFLFCNGVIPAISSIIRRLSSPADNVVVQTPVYHAFFNCIKNNGRQILQNELIYENGEYFIDFDDLEDKLSNPLTTLFILCNPHNPVGKIWDKQTLKRVGELCYKYGVIVISDEIHCDLTDPNKNYNAFMSVSEVCMNNSITCVAPTKTFNIAGIQSAAVVVANEHLRDKISHGFLSDGINEANAFASIATIEAYTSCDEWLDELRAYVFENKKIVDEFLKSEDIGVKLVKSEATYLLWLDCSLVSKDSTEIYKFLRKKAKLWLNDGAMYLGKGSFLRLNIACAKSTLKDGLNRLKYGIMEFKKTQNSK